MFVFEWPLFVFVLEGPFFSPLFEHGVWCERVGESIGDGDIQVVAARSHDGADIKTVWRQEFWRQGLAVDGDLARIADIAEIEDNALCLSEGEGAAIGRLAAEVVAEDRPPIAERAWAWRFVQVFADKVVGARIDAPAGLDGPGAVQAL